MDQLLVWTASCIHGARRKMFAYFTGAVDEELLLGNEYLAAENRILRS